MTREIRINIVCTRGEDFARDFLLNTMLNSGVGCKESIEFNCVDGEVNYCAHSVESVLFPEFDGDNTVSDILGKLLGMAVNSKSIECANWKSKIVKSNKGRVGSSDKELLAELW